MRSNVPCCYIKVDCALTRLWRSHEKERMNVGIANETYLYVLYTCFIYGLETGKFIRVCVLRDSTTQVFTLLYTRRDFSLACINYNLRSVPITNRIYYCRYSTIST